MPRPFVEIANGYARDVIAGKIVACKWVKAACQRHVDDLARKDWGYRFSAARAVRVCEFLECMRHIKGAWARKGECLVLEPWQCFLTCVLFGWVNKAGYRRFRIAYIEVARKNAKSTWAAGVLLYLLCADGETGAGVYSAATTRDQARIVFKDAQSMARKEPELCAALGLQVGAHAITVLDSDSTAQPLSAEANTLDGLNVSGAIVDELHAHPTRAVWDVIETATGSRSQPLVIAITTAGFDRSSVCYEQRSYVESVLSAVLARHEGMGYETKGNTHDDETYFGVIYTLDDGDDWQDEANWLKANPNLGVSVYADDIRRLAKKAAQMASAVANFLTKRMNVWVGAETSWMNMLAWNRAAVDFDLAAYRGMPAILAIDLASRVDIAALVGLIVDGDKLVCFSRLYCPEDTIEESANSQYRGWAAAGHLTGTDGPTIDFETIKGEVLEIAKTLNVRMIAFDKWDSTMFQQALTRAGISADIVEVPMNVSAMSAPMKDVEAAVLNGRIKHDGNPTFSWMMANVRAKLDAKDNVYPVKSTNDAKIDGPVALIMAMHCLSRIEASISVYEKRGAIIL